MDVASLTPRLLLGPGPSPVSPRIRRALCGETLGHLDPQFLSLLDDVNEGLREVFGTRNRTTFPVSGTGSAGMEATVVNLLEPGDTAIVGVKGVFGERLVEMCRRRGADVVEVTGEWGRPLDPDRLVRAQRDHPGARLLALVHAETSTGVRQPLEEVGAHLRGTDTLFVVDAVTSLGGIPVDVDRIGIDACYSGTQKCLGVPPGLAPITFSDRAVERIRGRSTPVASWYFDVTLIAGYLGSERRYHHTAPINLVYALHEAIAGIREEGLEARHCRHAEVGARAFVELAHRGFTPFAGPDEARLPQLLAVGLPGGRDEGPLRRKLLEEHGIEVGGGLGTARGRIWRIGLMGHGARHETVNRLLAAVDHVLGEA